MVTHQGQRTESLGKVPSLILQMLKIVVNNYFSRDMKANDQMWANMHL